MELVPIIWQTLLYGTILLITVLVVSYILSKLAKKTNIQNHIELVPDKTLYPTGRVSSKNIQITSSRHERNKILENQPKIYNINHLKRADNLDKKSSSLDISKKYSKGGGSSKPRYTIINENLTKNVIPLANIQSGDYYKFSNTIFNR